MTQGRLRIYLGAAPGVGKTVDMLNEGHRRLSRGTDVVVGVAETHGRAFTESLLAGLEVIPRKRVEYHGAVLEEMDVDAILARHPAIALVDELAHTNAPGSRHEKRYQDVLELLDAGINVISTVNIQHLESLNDAVTKITGIVQKETVPDEIVRGADQIDLVDMSPDALRRRMAHGHIYAPDQINAALANYFRPGNLSALRELALLWMADKVEAGLEDYRTEHVIAGQWPVRERVVVALSGDPGGEALLRRGARIASRLAGGEFLGVYVARPDGLRSAPVGTVAKLQDVTQQLGGEFHTISGDDPTQALLDFARGVNATQILVGTTTLPWWRRALAPSFAAQIIAGAGEIDVHVVNRMSSDNDPRKRLSVGLTAPRLWSGVIAAVVLPVVLTALLLMGDREPAPTLDIPLYLLITVAAGLIGGEVPAILAGVASSLLFNWFFVPPLGALSVTEPKNSVALIVFVLVGVLVAAIVHLNAVRTREAVAAQRESSALAELSHSLLGTTEQLPLLLSRAVDMFGVRAAAVLRTSAFTKPTVIESVGEYDADAPADHERVDDTHEIALQPPGLPTGQRRLFAAFAVHAAAILQREALAETAATASQAARDNASKTALLAVISHLRSPLAGIKTAISGLRDGGTPWSAADEQEFHAIETSANHLDGLMDNLLQLSRLQTGDVIVHSDVVDLRDALRGTVGLATDAAHARWTVEAAARYVLADPDLLHRGLGNILRNALLRQPARTPVTVTASRIADRVEIRVIDTGTDVPEGDFERLFAPLRQLGDSSDVEGLALALAVARGITEAQGGTVTAEATPGGGLTMVMSLPAPDGAG